MKEFDGYATLSQSIAMRIMCDHIRDTASLRDALGAHETVASFVGYLRTLKPPNADFWPQVYKRIGLDCPTELDPKLKEDVLPSDKKAWWRFW
jgi:hypothetical protein